MAKAREIKKRMKAVGNIRRITKTMQMIATSKFAKAQQRATASKPYVEGIFELVTELASKAGNITHPLIAGPGGEGGKTKPGARPLILLITSDRGLCGPYNSSILRAFFKLLKEEGGGVGGEVGASDKFNVEVVGRKGVGTLAYNKIATTRTHQFGDTPRYEEIERLAQQYMDQFTRGEITSVKIVSMRFISTARQRPEVMQLLPLKAPTSGGGDAKKGPSVQYDFTPPPEQLLADLLPATVKATLYQVFNDAIVSEHVARMVAMKSATDAAGKMGKLLNRRYNRARQSQITTELTEIISGAAALE